MYVSLIPALIEIPTRLYIWTVVVGCRSFSTLTVKWQVVTAEHTKKDGWYPNLWNSLARIPSARNGKFLKILYSFISAKPQDVVGQQGRNTSVMGSTSNLSKTHRRCRISCTPRLAEVGTCKVSAFRLASTFDICTWKSLVDESLSWMNPPPPVVNLLRVSF